MRNRTLEPAGLAKPGETHGLVGTGLGWARQESAVTGVFKPRFNKTLY